MMGEYILYCERKPVGGIYDDRLLVKPTPSACRMLPDAPRELPYPGAKELLLVEETDDRAFLAVLFSTIAADLPEGAEYHPGDAVQVTVDFWDIVWTLQPGSRIRLDISSSDFPQYAAHCNYAGIWADQEKTRVAHQTICAGEGSRLVLPLL
jgi:hypothetical protein